MNENNKTVRLIYPQWQGGNISGWVTQVSDHDAADRGYFLGSQLLNFLAPSPEGQEVITVPIDTAKKKREIQDGVLDRDVIAHQSAIALNMLKESSPSRIVTLGGECSVSVVPFTYLASKYDDVAMIWIDAHPDITLPGDDYAGYHAMAVTACMGIGDNKIIKILPAHISPQRILYVGIRDWERDEVKRRQEQYGIPYLVPEDVSVNSDKVIDWIKKSGSKHVVVHFDMDVLDPSQIIAAVADSPSGGMKLEEVVRLINDISKCTDVVGLTVAEPMPRVAIRLKMMLQSLPLLSANHNNER